MKKANHDPSGEAGNQSYRCNLCFDYSHPVVVGNQGGAKALPPLSGKVDYIITG